MRVHDRPFVRADGVRSRFQRSANVGDGGLARLGIQRTRLKHGVRSGRGQPFRQAFHLLSFGKLGIEQIFGRESPRRDEPAQPARCNSGNAVLDAVSVAQIGGLAIKQGYKTSTDIAEADQAEIERADKIRSWLVFGACQYSK